MDAVAHTPATTGPLGRVRRAGAVVRERWTARRPVQPVEVARLATEVPQLDALRASAPAAVRRIEDAHLQAFRYLRRDHATYEEVRLATALRGAAACPRADRAAELAAIAAEATARVEQALDREARRRYSAGLLLAVGVTLAVLAAVYWLALQIIGHYRGGGAGLTPGEHYALRDVLVCVGGGAAGAVVSVLVRIGHAARLPIGVSHWRLLAFSRVALGWLFAAALLFALKSGVVEVLALPELEDDGRPKDTVTSWFFWGILGFLAGFNERWVKNLLSRDPEEPAPPAAQATATSQQQDG